MLDLDAAVLDDGKAGGARLFGRRIVAQVQLHPDDARLLVQRQRFVDGLADHFAAAEDVDDVDGLRHVRQVGIDGLAEDLLAGIDRIDRDDVIAVLDQVAHDGAAHPVARRRGADDGDGGVGGQDFTQDVVGGRVAGRRIFKNWGIHGFAAGVGNIQLFRYSITGRYRNALFVLRYPDTLLLIN